MKILSAKEIKAWDAYTISQEHITSLQLMERAAHAAFLKLLELFPKQDRFVVVCGPGNNGGDGLVIARLLHKKGKKVRIYFAGDVVKSSADNTANQQSLPVALKHILTIDDFPKISENELIIDAIFGIGLNRPAEGVFALCIAYLNESKSTIISIDCPSGLLTDYLDQPENAEIIRAELTLTFQAPKRAFMVGRGLVNSGKVEIIDIGLSPDFIIPPDGNELFIQFDFIRKIYVPRIVNAEKRDYGQALLIGGSYGMIGAILLAGRAALRSGAGLVTILAPSCGYVVLQNAVPEAMVLKTADENILSNLPDLERFTVLAVGPGIGKDTATKKFIDGLLKLNRPMLLDADAINIIASQNWQQRIPKGSVITPHRREFARLFGEFTSEDELLKMHRENACKLGIYILLKGAHSRIIFPDGKIYYNSTGNPGMAKGGFGDSLTGIITGLWGRFNDVEKAVLTGVYLHGLAGDIAKKRFHIESMLPSDLIECLSDAFKVL